jgi:hypothetical protein
MMLTPKVSNVYNKNKIKPHDAEGIEPVLTEISLAQLRNKIGMGRRKYNAQKENYQP